MNLTLNERRTIYQILILIMKADFLIKPEEVKFLDQVFKDFNFTIAEFDHMDDVEVDFLKKEFATLGEDQKRYARGLFVEMSKCDGNIDPREMQLIELFS